MEKESDIDIYDNIDSGSDLSDITDKKEKSNSPDLLKKNKTSKQE